MTDERLDKVDFLLFQLPDWPQQLSLQRYLLFQHMMERLNSSSEEIILCTQQILLPLQLGLNQVLLPLEHVINHVVVVVVPSAVVRTVSCVVRLLLLSSI